MARVRRSDHRRAFVLGIGTIILTVGFLLVILGRPPGVLVAAALLLSIVALGQRLSWTLAVAMSVLLLLTVHCGLTRLAPVLGLDLALASWCALAVLGAAALVCFAIDTRAGGRAVRLPHRGDGPLIAGVLVVPAAALAYWMVSLGWGEWMRVGWLLANDAVWNTMSARFIVVDGGIDPAAHPNPAPLTASLAATWMLPGRSAAEQVLRHDVTREAQFVLLMAAVAAAFAALIAARAIDRRRRGLTVLVGAAAGGFVLGWYVLGFTVEFGFFNAPLALLILLAAWASWSEAGRSPAVATGGLLLSAVLLLATWAPLAVIPVALAGVAVLGRARRLLSTRGMSPVVPITSAALLLVYVAMVTLPDVRAAGSVLAADGATPPIEPRDVAGVAVLVLSLSLIALVAAPAGRFRTPAVGAIVVAGAAVVGGGYLVWQRVVLGLSWWGYYPAKFAWLVCAMLVIVGIATSALLASRLRTTPLRWTATVSLLAVFAVLAGGSPPIGGARRIPTPIALAADTQFALRDVAAERLFAIADAGRAIAVRDSEDPGEDALVNAWLLQSYSDRSEDPVRAFSYGIDTTDPAVVCDAVRMWGGEVRLLTRDPALTEELGVACPDGDYEVIVSS